MLFSFKLILKNHLVFAFKIIKNMLKIFQTFRKKIFNDVFMLSGWYTGI